MHSTMARLWRGYTGGFGNRDSLRLIGPNTGLGKSSSCRWLSSRLPWRPQQPGIGVIDDRVSIWPRSPPAAAPLSSLHHLFSRGGLSTSIHSYPILIFNLLDHRSALRTKNVDAHWSPLFAPFCTPDLSVEPLCLQHATHYTRVEHLSEGCCCRHADGESLDQPRAQLAASCIGYACGRG